MSTEVIETRKQKNWLLLVQGIALIVLSFLLFTTPSLESINFFIKLLGVWWLISGIASIVSIFFERDQWGWKLLLGILGILAGLIVLDHPLFAAFLLPVSVYVMGILGMLIGIVALIMAFTGSGWGAAVLGILSIIFGIILLANPVFVSIGLPYVLGGLALVGGVGSIIGYFKR